MLFRRLTLGTLTIATGLHLAAGHALAADRFWSDPTGGLYNDTTNWSGGAMPGVTDHGVFDIGGAYTVTVPSNFHVGGFKGRSGAVTIDLSGNQSTMDNSFSPGSVIVGVEAGDSGELTIRNGAVHAKSIIVGDQAGSVGALHMQSPLSWEQADQTTDGPMTVGRLGQGYLEVLRSSSDISHTTNVRVAGITIGEQAGSSGHIFVNGPGTPSLTSIGGFLNWRPINIGVNGEGTLEVGGGGFGGSVDGSVITVGPQGRVIMNGGTILARSSASFATVPPFNAIETTAGTFRSSGLLTLQGGAGGETRALLNGGGSLRADAGLLLGTFGDARIDSISGSLTCQNSLVSLGRVAGRTGEIMMEGGSMSFSGSTIHVGEHGDGALSLSQGTTGFAGVMRIGDQPNTTGALELDGAGTQLTLSSVLICGVSGDGLVSITDGAQITTPGGITIGSGAGSVGTTFLSGAGSLLKTTNNSSGSINVGQSGAGFLTALNGASVETNGSLLAGSFSQGGVGEVTVSGTNTTLDADLNIIIFNQSRFTAGAGALVTCRGFFTYDSVRTAITGPGTMVVTGVGGAQAGDVGFSALLSIDDEAELQAPSLLIRNGSSLDGRRGVISANLTSHGAVLPGAEHLQDADRLSHLDINGDYTQSATGELHININHDIAGAADNDALHITGAASLAGALIVEIAEDTSGGPLLLGAPFDPQTGASWDIITASNVFGTFDTETLPALPGDKFFVVEYEADRVKLVVRTSCPADLTGDGNVGSADLGALLGLWGACPAPCDADLTNDGFVGSGDLGVLLGSWGPCP